MIFGVAAVVAMLSIGAGAQQKVMAFIEQLGVRNLIVEAKEAHNWQELQKVRKNSPGLTLSDYQSFERICPTSRTAPRANALFGKAPSQTSTRLTYRLRGRASYLLIGHLRVTEGRFFEASENAAAAPVCVLGAAAKDSLFGAARRSANTSNSTSSGAM